MNVNVFGILAVGMTLAVGAASGAHHSFAGQFDPEGSMEIEGELVEIRWRNPHASFVVRTVANGETVDWELETAGASQMVRSGVQRDMLRIGDRVRVAGWPPVTDAREMHATNLLTPDGRELILFRGGAKAIRRGPSWACSACGASRRSARSWFPKTSTPGSTSNGIH